MPDMALRAWQLGWLLAVLGTGAAADGVAPSSGSGPAASTPARSLATRADIDAEHRRQRQLCDGLAVAAVRAECRRQADRSRDQALARLRPRAPASNGRRPPASNGRRPAAVSGSSAHSG
jgi:hypothetical protein